MHFLCILASYNEWISGLITDIWNVFLMMLKNFFSQNCINAVPIETFLELSKLFNLKGMSLIIPSEILGFYYFWETGYIIILYEAVINFNLNFFKNSVFE